VDGFYDDVKEISSQEKNLYRSVHFDIEEYKQQLGVKKLVSESTEEIFQRRWHTPSLSIHSITTSSNNAPTSIPYSVNAQISVRTVPNQNSAKIQAKIKQFLHEEFQKISVEGYTLQIETSKVGEWWEVNRNAAYYKAAEDAITHIWNQSPTHVCEGGTIPLTSYLEKALSTGALLLPLGQASDSAHLKNERIRLENLVRGKDVVKLLLKNLGKSAKHTNT